MPLLVNSVPNLAQGVSQQPDNLRFPGQCDEQINAWATVVEGLVKRPPTNYTKKLDTTSTDSDKLFTHFVKRSEQNKYCVNVSLGGVGVINLGDGTNIPVAVTSIANSYLSLGGQASLGAVQNPLADLRALTVADYTFLVNRNRVIERSEAAEQKSTPPGGTPDYVSYLGNIYKCIASHTSTLSFDSTKWQLVTNVSTASAWVASTAYKAQEHEALIVVKLGDYEKNYSVIIDDLVVPHISGLHSNKTPSAKYTYESGTSSTGLHADTTVIAEDLAACIAAATTASSGISRLNIINGGAGWLDGNSSGDNSQLSASNFYWKVQLEITQPAVSTATSSLFELIITKGVITGYSILRQGKGFNTGLGGFVQTFKVYYSWDNKQWLTSSTPNAWVGSGQNIVPLFNTRTTFEVTKKDSVIKIKSFDGPFKIRVEDGLGSQALGVVYREVNSITDLPSKCFNNFIVKVIGDADIDQDDYYVRFSTKEKEDFGEGSWIETVGYYQDESPGSLMEGIDTLLDSNTMPVTLVPYFNDTTITDFRLQTPNELLIVKQGTAYYRLDKNHRASDTNKPGVGADWQEYWAEVTSGTPGYLEWKGGTFYYGPNVINNLGGWNGRTAGDDFTNPFPSFVGRTIRDIFFFKNRLRYTDR